ncbi:disease resistance-like protein DSC1 [Neltuma alba]|uniref:disease resistance-like protein DSC1 n=1 Tax=Neltuma alba TaxID=207710 RepID=UPI0010A55F4E|nr:disease resistance-like protein DSC1 [Prosopis alba]
MAAVESLLCKGSNNDGCKFIGIWGMGSVGKTTLARALFNKLCFTYDGFCFLANVREQSRRHGIDALRGKLILKLSGEKESHIGMLDAIDPYAMSSRLDRKKVFIVLDDVDDVEQLQNLVGRYEFGSGSKILITTRDRQVLAGIKVVDIYVLDRLDSYEAFDLLSINAFRNDYADKKIKKLAKKMTQYADGNPLALKVLGSLLNGKNQEAWESQLDKLQKFPCVQVNHILKSSFEQLDKEERNIFLYIACFFDNYNIEDVKHMLNACGYSTEIGLKRLEEKALLDVHKKRIGMHHLIKEMGREIVRDESLEGVPNKCNILWIFKNNSEILKKNMVNGAIEGMIMDLSEVEQMYIIIEALCLMPKLMNLVNLSRIDLHESKDLIELPNFSKAIHLAEVDLEGCSKLQNIHPSILSLHSLRHLLLRNCTALTSLTSNTHLKSLAKLDMVGCSRLSEFAVTSENSEFQLLLLGTAINGELCSSSGHLNKIYFLNLDGCEGVTGLHKLFDLHTLRRLDAAHCNELAPNLHSTFDEMRALQVLKLKDCSKLLGLPDNISLLSSLRELDLSGSNIEALPFSIKYLSRLQHLYLNECKSLRSLPELPPSISRVSADDCLSLETLHSPLMSEDREGTQYYYLHFSFKNCMKLDGESIKAVEAKVLLDINNEAIYYRATMKYPGKRVAEWFMYRTTQSTITVDLSSILQPWGAGFIFCAVISGSSGWMKMDAELFIDGQYAYTSPGESFPMSLLSDHVVFWYDAESCGEVQRTIEEKKREAQSNTSYRPLLLQIKFTTFSWGSVDETRGQIKECGVGLASAVEYQNYIEQIQLASLHPHPNSNAMESVLQSKPNSAGIKVGCSCDHTNDKQVVPRKSKDCAFPSPSTVTWKNGTRGLKDIMFL